MADLPPEVWTSKLHGQVRNFIKQEHDGDEDAAVDEIERIFEAWGLVKWHVRVLSSVPSFYEFYKARRIIRSALYLVGVKKESMENYKEVKL